MALCAIFFLGPSGFKMTLNCRIGGSVNRPSYLNFQEHHHAFRNVLAETDVWSLGLYSFHFQRQHNYQVKKISKILFGLEPPIFSFTGLICPNPNCGFWLLISVASQLGPYSASGYYLKVVWLRITRYALNCRLSGKIAFGRLWLQHLILTPT